MAKSKTKVSEVKKSRQIIRGRVVSAKQPQTVTVLVESTKTHPLYGKTFKRSKKYLVHDGLGVSEGDLVEITQIRPISKNKHFQVVKVVGKDIEAIITEQLKEEAQEAIAEVMPEEEKGEEGQVLSIKDEEVKEEKEEKKAKRGKK